MDYNVGLQVCMHIYSQKAYDRWCKSHVLNLRLKFCCLASHFECKAVSSGEWVLSVHYHSFPAMQSLYKNRFYFLPLPSLNSALEFNKDPYLNSELNLEKCHVIYLFYLFVS